MLFVAERRLNLAQPFKAGITHQLTTPSSPQRRLKHSIVTDVTKWNIFISILALRGRAKLMPTLRVESLVRQQNPRFETRIPKFVYRLTQTVIRGAPQALPFADYYSLFTIHHLPFPSYLLFTIYDLLFAVLVTDWLHSLAPAHASSEPAIY